MENQNPFSSLEAHLVTIERKLDALSSAKPGTPEYLSIDEASDMIKLGKQAIYERVMKNKIPYYKSGRKLVFKRADLVAFIESSRKTTNGNAIELEK